mmetsp:Transcript_33698/g.53863  ORF Transcript_33698/g.53863 Transcript_33698/m.53863 type:complete len:120 (+) Transcript_33698:523-882(+)
MRMRSWITCKASWKESLIHGYACYTWADGRRYRGQYVEDRKEGYGVYKWPDGTKYEGYFSQGRQHGRGKYTYIKGEYIEGIWKRGKRDEDAPMPRFRQQGEFSKARGGPMPKPSNLVAA